MTSPDWSQQIAVWADEWHDDLVKFLVRRHATPADAQDLAQEVYLRLLRVDRRDLVLHPRAYLLRIAANLLYEWRLKARQALPHEGHEIDRLPSPDNPERSTIAILRARRLTAELDQLAEPVRAALILQVRDGLSYEEIATTMNVTPRMIKRYLLTAYASLRARVPSDL